MNFQNLVDQISKEYPINPLSSGINSEILNVSFIDGIHDNNRTDTLYFGYDKQLKSLPNIPNQCILAKTDDSLLIPQQPNNNIALVKEDLLFCIFNDSKNLIESECKGLFEELTSLANETHSIDEIIDTASVRLGNSLIFCDMNYKIIASSTTFPIIDPLWQENTRQGYCSYDFIHSIKELKSTQNNSHSTTAIEVSCPDSPYRKLTCKVFHNKKQIGFLLLIESENQILAKDFQMLSTISHVVSYNLSYFAPNLIEENNSYRELLYDMLIGAPQDQILHAQKSLPFSEYMVVLYFRPTRYLGQQYLNQFALKHLTNKIQGIHYVFHKKGIVCIMPVSDPFITGDSVKKFLEDLCEKEYIRIGVSNVFNSIEHFITYYDQAAIALDLALKLKSENAICYYQYYQIYDLFSQVSNPANLGRFCHPALGILRQYDLKNNSELYKTLCVFINKGCNIKNTAESLFIHRNSLVYRLDRITKMCQLSFEDTNTVFLLRLSFLIDRYNELNNETEWM